ADFPVINRDDTKMPIAVLTIGIADINNVYSDSQALTPSLQGMLADRFEVLERNELQAVLGEQQLSAALGSVETALQLHNVAIAQYMVAGYYQELGAGTAVLAAKVIDCETTKVFAVDTALKGTDSTTLQ